MTDGGATEIAAVIGSLVEDCTDGRTGASELSVESVLISATGDDPDLLDLDSLAVLDLFLGVEERYGVPIEAIADVVEAEGGLSVERLVDLIEGAAGTATHG